MAERDKEDYTQEVFPLEKIYQGFDKTTGSRLLIAGIKYECQEYPYSYILST